ncbi:hypothetical protein ACNKHT_27575 [Shigella flexneri]
MPAALLLLHYAFSSGGGGYRTETEATNTSKSPSYTKSVSWQHYQENRQNPFERRSANAGSFCNDYSSRSPSGR